jgi:rubrerythrin
MVNNGMHTEGNEKKINIQGLLDFQIRMEKRISRIYRRIAGYLSGPDPKWAAFWERLAVDEENHAILLSLEKEFLQSGVHLQRPVEIDPQTLEEFDLLLQKCEEKIGPGLTRKEVIGILVSIETSEVDSKIFSSLLGATDSKVLAQFTSIFKAHQEYIKWVLEETRKFEIGEEK